MGIKNNNNITIINRGNKNVPPKISIVQKAAENLIDITKTNTGYSIFPYKGVNKIPSYYNNSIIPGIDKDDVEYYLRLYQNDIKDNNDKIDAFRNFFRLWNNKDHKRADNDYQITKSPSLYQTFLDRGWISEKKARTRSWLTLTEKGERAKILYANYGIAIPHDDGYLKTKYIHPIYDGHKKVFEYKDKIIFTGFSNYNRGGNREYELVFADLNPEKKIKSTNPKYVNSKDAVIYKRLLTEAIKKFTKGENIEIKPVLYDKRWAEGRVIFYGENNNQGVFFRVDANQYAYFKKRYGNDIKITSAPLETLKQAGYADIPLALWKDEKLVGFISGYKSDVDEPTEDTTKIKIGGGNSTFPSGVSYNLWRHFNKL